MTSQQNLPTWLGGIYILGEAAAIHAAQSVGLFSSLMNGRGTPEVHAARTSCDARMMRRVLDVLVGIGLAEEENGEYFASPVLAVWAEKAPGGLEAEERIWSGVVETLRTGEPVVRPDSAARAEAYKHVTRRLSVLLERSAAQLAGRVDVPEHARILDIGCGAGVWSIALATRHASARITGLDYAPVLETFNQAVAAAGVGDRAGVIEGDVMAASLEEGAYDVVIAANILRLGDPDFWRAMLARAVAALSERGTLVVVDAFSSDTPGRARARNVYALHLGARTPSGEVPDVARVEQLLAEAGLRCDPLILFDDEQAAMAGALLARRTR